MKSELQYDLERSRCEELLESRDQKVQAEKRDIMLWLEDNPSDLLSNLSCDDLSEAFHTLLIKEYQGMIKNKPRDERYLEIKEVLSDLRESVAEKLAELEIPEVEVPPSTDDIRR